jgi:hypothetical protein
MKTDRTFKPAKPPSSQTRPLILGPSPVRNHYMQRNAPAGSSVNVCISPTTRVPASSVQSARSSGIGPRLHDLGWIEYHLPDETVYYVHPTRRMITDVDLRIDSTLDVVTTFLKRKDGNLPKGTELWIREGPRSKQGFVVPSGWRVDHMKQVVHFDCANEASGNAKRKNVDTNGGCCINFYLVACLKRGWGRFGHEMQVLGVYSGAPGTWHPSYQREGRGYGCTDMGMDR